LPWPLFISFIWEEENFFKNFIINLLNTNNIYQRKYRTIKIQNRYKNISKLYFFKYDKYSYRIDSFFAIFYFNILKNIQNLDKSTYNYTDTIDNIIQSEHIKK